MQIIINVTHSKNLTKLEIREIYDIDAGWVSGSVQSARYLVLLIRICMFKGKGIGNGNGNNNVALGIGSASILIYIYRFYDVNLYNMIIIINLYYHKITIFYFYGLKSVLSCTKHALDLH